jgi:pimeloyl-ACP methyl ester carboxylesterase
MLAGYSALRLLAVESPDSLDRLADSDWQFWTRIVLSCLTNDRDASTRSLLVANAYARAKDIFLSTLDDVVTSEDERHGQVFVISHIGEFWNDELATMLRPKITAGALKPGSFKTVLARLLKMGDTDVKVLARTMATGVVPVEGEDRRRAVFASAELISHDPREWNVIWPVLQTNEAFAVEVLEVVASEHEHRSFATSLEEGEIADICIWLSRLGLEKANEDPNHPGRVTPRVALANWWNTLVNLLTYKGTEAACHAIRQLIEALPQYEGLRWNLKEAEERTRRATWIPLSPEEVIRLAAHDTAATLIISLHGIRTRGVWQKKVNSELQKNGFRHELLDYGHFMAVQLLMPWRRARQVDWFRGEYERLVAEHGVKPSIVAHSFGTYIVANAMQKYAELRFDRIIFCGSLVRRDYDWNSIIESGRVKAVLNEYGAGDIWVKLAALVVPGVGASGAKGFSTSSSCVYQRSRPAFRHSDYFYPLNYRDNWIPFLSGAEPSQQPVERKAPTNWKFRIAMLVLAVALAYLLIAKAGEIVKFFHH